jgi:zinc transport system substrate-binding protein
MKQIPTIPIYGCLLTLYCSLMFIWPFPLPNAAASEKIPVFVSIPPQKYFVKSIGGNLTSVSVMVQPGASPTTYEPKPKQMVKLSKCKLYFAIGVPFEASWLPRITRTNSSIRIVHTDKNIEKRQMATAHSSHGNPDPTDDIKDPHIWLSPPLVKIQAETILNALVAENPAASRQFKENYSRFIQSIDTLDSELRETLSGIQTTDFMVFHPSWGYFADTYGLKQIPIEIEGKSPKPAQLKSLISFAKRENIKIIFAQPQFSTQNAEMVAKSIGGKVVFADPLAFEWSENLRKQASAFKSALRHR